jgi:hypothetical protein
MVKSYKTNKKGGIRLSSEYVKQTGTSDRKSATQFFLVNSTFRLLTNNSISCITLVASLKDTIPSPFKSMRSNNIQLEVRSILLKIFLTNPVIKTTGWYNIPGRKDHDGIEITTLEEFEKEIETQKQIYQKSFVSDSSLMDAICPAIIYYNKDISKSDIQNMKNLPGLITDSQTQLNKILDGLLSVQGTTISIIYMELMEGFETAQDYFWNRNLYIPDTSSSEKYRIVPSNDYEKFLLYIIQYEFQRLSRLGYYHGDSHYGNVMINVNYKYFMYNPNNNFTGRAIIIDFGRTTELLPEDIIKAKQGDVSIYNRERYSNYIPSNLILTPEYYNLLRQARLNYINGIAGPMILQNFNVKNITLKQFVDQIINMNQYNFTKIGGENLNMNMNKIDNNFDNNILVKSNNSIIKKQNQVMNTNNNNIFEKFKIELEEQNKMDPSSIFSLEPISKQIKGMDIKQFQTIIQNQYFNSEDVLQEKVGGKNKKYKKYKTKRINKLYKKNKFNKTNKFKKKYY